MCDSDQLELWREAIRLVDDLSNGEVLISMKELVLAFETALGNGADPNYKDGNGIPLLSRVASNGYVDVALLMIKNGSDINIGDNYKRPPLMGAIFNFSQTGSTEMIDCLIKSGADINHQDQWGETPFYQFARKPNSACPTLMFFLETGADCSLAYLDRNIVELLRSEAPEETVAMIESYLENQKMLALISVSNEQQQVIF